MKLQDLKHHVYDCWADLSAFRGALVQPELFKGEVRSQFGDLRYKATWEAALCHYLARNAYDACLDAWSLILVSFNLQPGDRFYDYRHQIFSAFLQLPEGLDLIKAGLDQLYSTDFTPQERQEAQGNGFFAMVREQSTVGGLGGGAAQLIGQLEEIGATATS